MMPSRKLYKLSTSHSKKFWSPPGTDFMSRVATCAKAIRPRATIQVTTMEFVIEKLAKRAISSAFCDNPCSSLSGGATVGAICAIAEEIREFLSDAPVRLTLRIMNAATRRTGRYLILNLSKQATRLEMQHGLRRKLRQSVTRLVWPPPIWLR